MQKWNHKDEWRIRGKDFLVMVSRHSMDTPSEFNFDDLGPNRWAVYAYIYPKHELFSTFINEKIFSDAANALPLHAGASLVRIHYGKDSERMSIQVGADYNHLHDEMFSRMDSKESASEVFVDAERLYAFLETPT